MLTSSRQRQVHLPELASTLIRRDLRAIVLAQLRVVKSTAQPDAPDAVEWLAGMAGTPIGSSALRALVRAAPATVAGGAVAWVVTQTVAHLDYAATLARTFIEELPTTVAWLEERATGDPRVDALAAARARLASDPELVRDSLQQNIASPPA